MRKLEWLVVKDNWEHETVNFWKTAPEVKSGEVKPQDIKTEVFFFPAAQVAETEGTFTNTQRMLQSHFKATEPPGDCRTDVCFTYQLGKRLKKLYAGSQAPRDQGFKNLLFDYEHEDPKERQIGEPSAKKLLKEMNGYYTNDPGKHLPGFAVLADDGSTTCASWIYSGVFSAPDRNLAANKPPTAKAIPGGIGLDAHSGTDPFLNKSDGVGWLYVPTGLLDGPLPTQYEPAESPVHNPMYKQQSSPVLKYWKESGNPLAIVGDPKFPYVMTTYRLTEHYLAGAMSRWLPWLTELQPELFVEISPELAQEKGIQNLDWVRVSSPRSQVRAKALVTRRLRPLQIDGRTIHHVGMPWHWGYEGLVTGDIVNELTALVGDPNVTIHEGKAFVCNIEKA